MRDADADRRSVVFGSAGFELLTLGELAFGEAFGEGGVDGAGWDGVWGLGTGG